MTQTQKNGRKGDDSHPRNVSPVFSHLFFFPLLLLLLLFSFGFFRFLCRRILSFPPTNLGCLSGVQEEIRRRQIKKKKKKKKLGAKGRRSRCFLLVLFLERRRRRVGTIAENTKRADVDDPVRWLLCVVLLVYYY